MAAIYRCVRHRENAPPSAYAGLIRGVHRANLARSGDWRNLKKPARVNQKTLRYILRSNEQPFIEPEGLRAQIPP